MMEADRVLRPLREAEPAIDRLDTYESPAVLTEALRATWQAVERTLRSLLRSDGTAPDSVRLTAMSPEQMTVDTVLTELRRRDLVSLSLAGRVHELRQALARAERGEVRASDADNARDVVRVVTEEVHGVVRRVSSSPGVKAGAGLRAEHAPPPAYGVADVEEDAPRYGGLPVPQRPIVVGAIAALVLIGAVAAVLMLGGESEMERGVAAFADGRKAVAEQHFRSVLAEDADHVTARLYLARILREQGQNEEAAQLLRSAAETAPEDPAVRRELGYLFLDLDRPQPAAEQFRRAVELDAEEPLNWVGLIEALTRNGDPSAAQWLSRAPAEAQAIIRDRQAR
jgi:tetratricopeptide (TPR) repeat protein